MGGLTLGHGTRRHAGRGGVTAAWSPARRPQLRSRTAGRPCRRRSRPGACSRRRWLRPGPAPRRGGGSRGAGSRRCSSGTGGWNVRRRWRQCTFNSDRARLAPGVARWSAPPTGGGRAVSGRAAVRRSGRGSSTGGGTGTGGASGRGSGGWGGRIGRLDHVGDRLQQNSIAGLGRGPGGSTGGVGQNARHGVIAGLGRLFLGPSGPSVGHGAVSTLDPVARPAWPRPLPPARRAPQVACHCDEPDGGDGPFGGRRWRLALVQVAIGQAVPDHLERQEMLPLLAQDPAQALHVGFEELAVARR